MRINLKLAFSLLIVVILSTSTFAQVTRSGISGNITDSSGKPVANALVLATHEPTGSNYTAATDSEGNFQINNMRVGGPYTMRINDEILEQGIMLSLGQTYSFYGELTDKKTTQLADVTVQGVKNSTFNKNRTGAENTVNREQLESLPNISGSIADFVRISPQVDVSDGADGFSISIAGQNNRYNAVYIDGGVNNDVFGLSGSGMDGGQTGGNPFAYEELDQLTVSVAPFDVKQSGFAGGAINAVTRSGTNNLQGSAYYFFRRNSLSGKQANYVEAERKELSDFSINKFGFSLAGPLVKNKLFFFATYEKEDNTIPNPFSFAEYRGQAGLSAADLAALKSGVLSTYGYDIGNYDDSKSTLEADKFITRLDWNINDRNKLSLKYKYLLFQNLESRVSTPTAINFDNGSEYFESKKHEIALEWNSSFGKYSNNLLINGKIVRDDRDFLGDPFPTVGVATSTGNSITFGNEPFSTANNLSQDVITFLDYVEADFGKHKVTLGGQFDYYNMYNLFIGQNFGQYFFGNQINASTSAIFQTGLQRFLTYLDTTSGNESPMYNGNNINLGGTNYNFTDSYTRSYSLLENNIGDDATGSAAEFKSYAISAFLQDEWNISTKFKLTAGVRFDIPMFENSRENPDFNSITLPRLIAAGKDLNGANIGNMIKSSVHISPRVGFNWKVDPQAEYKTQIRGGTGIFTSRMPMVWLGGAYNNTGTSLGQVTLNNLPNFNNASSANYFVDDPAAQYTNAGLKYTGQIDIFDPEIKLPQRWRNNLGWDQELPLGLVLTTDVLYDKVINDVYYQNVNLTNPIGRLTGTGDTRTIWNSTSLIDNNYTAIYYGSNTSEGYSYNIATSLSKKFKNGFVSLSYSYGDSYGIFEGTSSQNSSQWRGIQTVNGANDPGNAARTSFSVGSRINSLVSYSFKYAGDKLKTTVALVYEGQQGTPYSFIYGGTLHNDGANKPLIYVPKDASDIVLSNGYLGFSSAYQWNLLNNFIENDPYLRAHRGQYVERNSHRTPWTHIVDVRLLQDFALKLGNKEHNFQLSCDIVNFTNLLNKDWGRRYTASFAGYNLLQVVSVNNNGNGTYTPVLGVNPDALNERSIRPLDNFGTDSSIWQIQLGIRYFFK